MVRTVQPTAYTSIASVSIKDGSVIKEAPVKPEAYTATQTPNMIKPLIVVDEMGNMYEADINHTGIIPTPQMEVVYLAPKNEAEKGNFISRIPWWAWLLLALVVVYGAQKSGLFKTGK